MGRRRIYIFVFVFLYSFFSICLLTVECFRLANSIEVAKKKASLQEGGNGRVEMRFWAWSFGNPLYKGLVIEAKPDGWLRISYIHSDLPEFRIKDIAISYFGFFYSCDFFYRRHCDL